MIAIMRNKALWARLRREYSFGRIARRTPDRVRFALVVLAFGVTTGLPAIALAGVAGAGAGEMVSRIWSVPHDHAAAAAAALVVMSFALVLIMPLIKAAWSKMQSWDREISMTKYMED